MSLNTQSQLYEAVLQVRVSFADKNLMIDNLNNSKGMIIVLCIMNDYVYCSYILFLFFDGRELWAVFEY